MASDGRLMFNTKLDNSQIDKDLRELERKIKRSQEEISNTEAKKLPLIKQAEELGGKLDAAKQKAARLKAEMESIRLAEAGADPLAAMDAYARKADVTAELKQSENEVVALQKQWDAVNDKVDTYDLKIQKANTDITRATQKTAELNAQMAKPSQIKMAQAMEKADKAASRFNRRLWEIAKSAFVFNIVSSGLRKMATYMGQAMLADKDFAGSLSALNGSIVVAFQPIYEVAVPAITTLINWLNVAVQLIGRFFAILSGKSYSQMQKNAKALNKQAGAIGSVGDAAEEAKKQLLGFDEINRLESTSGSGSGGGVGGSAPTFEEIEIPDALEAVIESLAMRIKDILFKWDDLTPEDIAEKLVVALGAMAGGLIGFALGGPGGAVIGMLVGAGIGIAIATVLFNHDGKLTGEELLSALIVALASITGGVIGFAIGGPLGAALGMTIGAALGVKLTSIMFDGDGKLSSEEIIKALVAGLSILAGAVIGFAAGGPAGAVMGAVVGLALAFTIQAVDFEGVESVIKQMLENVRNYFSTTFSDGFVHGLAVMVQDGVTLLWNFFVDFVNSVIDNWNRIWGGISSYQTTGTIAPASMPPTNARSIPALAQGAVLPANRPFMAMVGDQKNGTNIEAPLETIKQALAEVMAQYGGGDVQITFAGELAALGRVLAPVVTKAQKEDDRGRGR